MQGYHTYKDSEVEWIGTVPTSWDISPLFTVASESKISNKGMIENNLLSLSYGRIIQKDIETLGGLLPGSFETYQVVNENDIIFRLTDLQNDKRSLRSAICDERGIITSAYVAVTPKKIRPKFMHYLMRSYDETKVFYNLGSGMRQSLKYDELKRLPLVTPPESDQEQIENFLDRETARIDNLIAEKQTFIKLLKEKRQALISHVGTKGLDPSVKMKDSGVEWIGEVPEHWEHGKIKYIARVSNGATPNRDTNEFWDGGTVGWLNSSKVNDVYIENADQFITELAVEKTSVQPVKPNDLVMAITGEGQTRGRVAICKAHATINQHLAAISVTRKQIDVEYLFFWLTSQYLRIRYESSGAGSTKGAITCTDIGCYPVPIPPRAEQELIVSAVKEKLSSHDALQRETESSIKFLQEHRTALISAAVTGKIDVRSQVPTSPDRPQPQESAHA